MVPLTNQQLENILKNIREELAKNFFEEKRRERMRPDLSRRNRDTHEEAYVPQFGFILEKEAPICSPQLGFVPS